MEGYASSRSQGGFRGRQRYDDSRAAAGGPGYDFTMVADAGGSIRARDMTPTIGCFAQFMDISMD